MKSAKTNKNVYTEQFKVNSVYDGEKGQINIDTNINGVPKKIHIDFTKNDLDKMNIEDPVNIENMMNIENPINIENPVNIENRVNFNDSVNFNDLLTLNSVDSPIEKRLQTDFLFPSRKNYNQELFNTNIGFVPSISKYNYDDENPSVGKITPYLSVSAKKTNNKKINNKTPRTKRKSNISKTRITHNSNI